MATVPPRANVLALALLLTAAGCQGVDGPLARWRTAHDDAIAPAPTRDEAGEAPGLMARWLGARGGQAPRPAHGLVRGSDGWSPLKSPANPEADAEFLAAERLFQQGELAGAESAFARAARKRKDTPWGEKAQYFLAETKYQRGNYVGAHDAFEELIATYPGTQFLEKAVAREYAIAQDWLAAAESRPESEEVQPTSWSDRFTGRLPLADLSGHALQVLEHVRHHDPTGPLADDAALRIADYHFARADYESASVYYDQLIADHPKSPHLNRAQMASIDSKIKAYLGPDYDGTGLEKARELIQQHRALFPERQAAVDDQLDQTMALIQDQQAERAYHTGEFYRRTGKVAAAEYSFAEIPARWPKTEWAKQAKVQLAELAKMPRTATLPSKIMTTPGSPDPFANGVGSANPLGTVGGTPGGVATGP